jgi:hypothetical protein
LTALPISGLLADPDAAGICRVVIDRRVHASI